MYRIPRYTVSLVKEKSIPAPIKTVSAPKDAFEIMWPMMENLPVEHFQIVMLDTKNHVIGTSLVTVGTLNATIVQPREVFQRAILANAASIILAHNHPSGDTAPSSEDITITKKLTAAGDLLDIKVLDHIIVGDGKFYSFKEAGII